MMKQIEKLDMKKLKAILIDMDGTLAESMGLLYQTYLSFLKLYGYQGTKEEFKRLVGPSIREVLEELKTKYQILKESSDLIEEYHQILREIYIHQVELMPGALQFIQQIKQKPITLALVTSADKVLANAFLDSHHIGHYFDQIITPEGLQNSKPAADIYERALQKLQLTSDEVVAIEDSPNGILASLGAGIYTIQILHNKSAEVFHHESCLPLNGWHDILNYFQGR